MENTDCRIINLPMSPCVPLRFDAEKCVGCNTCVNTCRVDILIPNPEKGKPPIVAYPDECWFCGCCVEHCMFSALSLEPPLAGMVAWKRRDTGEIYRRGMKNPPAPVVHPAIDGIKL